MSECPVTYASEVQQDAAETLRLLEIAHKTRPKMLAALQAEIDIDVHNWAHSGPEDIEIFAGLASGTWVALGILRWRMLVASLASQSEALLGTRTALELLKHADELEAVASSCGDWHWACQQLQRHVRKYVQR